MTVRVLYRQDEDTWVASSPDVPRWTVVADTYAEAHQLAEDGVRFVLERDDLTVDTTFPPASPSPRSGPQPPDRSPKASSSPA
jgi:predicted RNase H-like HicB family nuclease